MRKISLITMKKIYHLSSCDTCQRIIKEINPGEDVILQDIKKNPITADQLEEMRKLTGNYENLFSKASKKFKVFGLNDQPLTEEDYRKYILVEYTFLKRPVIIVDGKIFIGNTSKAVEGAKAAFA